MKAAESNVYISVCIKLKTNPETKQDKIAITYAETEVCKGGTITLRAENFDMSQKELILFTLKLTSQDRQDLEKNKTIEKTLPFKFFMDAIQQLKHPAWSFRPK